jgi:hypothetical protein
MSVLHLEEARAEEARAEEARAEEARTHVRVRETKGTPSRPRPRRSPARPARGWARSGTPRLRPAAPLPAPTLAPAVSERRQPRGCAASLPRTAQSTATSASGAGSWRITDRGIAVVLVAVAMIAVAALAVIVPTALRVTGDNYQPIGTVQLAQR